MSFAITEKGRADGSAETIPSNSQNMLIGPEKNATVPYSSFTKPQKRLIVLLVAFAVMFSPLSSFIYYPAITWLSKDLRVSIELVNLTITSYMIVSGVAPATIGDLADMTGRRWVYILTMPIYCATNVGLALQRSWSALLVLRMVQSAGSSVNHDFDCLWYRSRYCNSCRKRIFFGAVLCGPNIATSLGPVLGGALSEYVGWWWVFWFLAILSGFCLFLIILLLPETCRLIVGNGSIATDRQYQTLLSLFCQRNINKPRDNDVEPLKKRKFHIPNPISRLKLLFHKSTSLIVLVNGIFYMTYGCIQASISSLFIEPYDFKKLEAGLIYLPFGAGCALPSSFSGKVMNWDYKRTAKDHDFVIDKIAGDDMTRFPIEKARYRSIWYPILISSACIAGYGWALHTHVLCSTLLVDLHPRSPASAQAALNIFRCTLSVGGLALVQLIIDRVGVGWCFTIFAGLCLSMIFPVLVLLRYGMSWRTPPHPSR
ncbi:hypothetical protein HYFRA_00010399 [Hymenoscyphus fraxineus]|uniref:Major facilitator superfamily (MFS) profile domain-containing protein n=1 Tax=Hymenoscyphus fraxineus TaxID=746836 RepID=A0A9N9PW92_9HELO|nr:hypothetical protein HYFRA_00010399 [Hymenoscyphus fraxineus]